MNQMVEKKKIVSRSTGENLDCGMINRAVYHEHSCAKEVNDIFGNFGKINVLIKGK